MNEKEKQIDTDVFALAAIQSLLVGNEYATALVAQGAERADHKEKQIEEMARIMEHDGCSSHDCEKCYGGKFGADCTFFEDSRALYDAGYRKQSEGEWVFEHEYYGKMLCSNCKGEALVNECSEYVDSDFCPNCGAKMKGV